MEAINSWVQINETLVYAILFGYCAFKSGALPLFAGILVQTGALSLGPVVMAAFLGGYLGDEARFALARRYGEALMARWPRTRRWLETGKQLMARYGAAYIFLYRYPKGMRTIGALPVGLGAMPWLRFTTLNAASAALWTAILVSVGYAFGASITRAVESHWGWASVALLAAFVLAAWIAIRRLTRNAPMPGRPTQGREITPTRREA